MKYLITSFLLIISSPVFAQHKSDTLKKIIQQSDTVIIVSHKLTQGPIIVDDKTSKRTTYPKLLTNNRPNERIILERKIIVGRWRDTLLSILTRPNKTFQEGMCFMPHHAIFFITKQKISFIEICFACRKIETSIDLNDSFLLDESKWHDLETFFTGQGLKYEIERLE